MRIFGYIFPRPQYTLFFRLSNSVKTKKIYTYINISNENVYFLQTLKQFHRFASPFIPVFNRADSQPTAFMSYVN